MANTVLLIGDWLLKQQQQIAIQQRLLEENNVKFRSSRSRLKS